MMRTGLWSVVLALLVAGCAGSPVSTNYFYVGGQYVGEGSSRKLSGHMYVQVFEPAVKKHAWPVVLVHGNSQSGNNFIGTVDGRPGWAQDFSSRGYTVYVVDQVGRGRSGTFPSLYGASGEPSISLVELLARAPDTTFPTARLNTQWPDKGVAGEPYFDQFLAQQMPSIRDVVKIEELNLAAHLALLEKIGPPPASVLQASPNGPDLVPCYLQAGTPRTLPQLAKVIIGLFTAEASLRTASDHCNALFLHQAGVKVDHVRLSEVGVRGNGHMMMLEKNSSEVAGAIMGWSEGKGL